MMTYILYMVIWYTRYWHIFLVDFEILRQGLHNFLWTALISCGRKSVELAGIRSHQQALVVYQLLFGIKAFSLADCQTKHNCKFPLHFEDMLPRKSDDEFF
jgi:hypothetical protein